MNQGHDLRSGPWVALAYLAAPIASLFPLWAFFTLPTMFAAQGALDGGMATLGPFLLAGEVAGLLVELALVTPILMAVRFLQWRWISLWVAGLMGLAIGVAVALLLVVQGIGRGGDNLTMLRVGLTCGLAGIVSAAVFHLIAMRRVKVQSLADVF